MNPLTIMQDKLTIILCKRYCNAEIQQFIGTSISTLERHPLKRIVLQGTNRSKVQTCVTIPMLNECLTGSIRIQGTTRIPLGQPRDHATRTSNCITTLGIDVQPNIVLRLDINFYIELYIDQIVIAATCPKDRAVGRTLTVDFPRSSSAYRPAPGTSTSARI